MNSAKQTIEDIFKPIIGLVPRIDLGHGSFLTLNFGKDIPQELLTRKGREVVYLSEWSLWIYMCAWRIDLLGEPLIGSDDDKKAIEKTIFALKDKKILEFSLLNSSFDSLIKFESGVELHLFSCNITENQQWIFYTKEKKVFTAGPGKSWSYENAS
jgi:hypothetical protein